MAPKTGTPAVEETDDLETHDEAENQDNESLPEGDEDGDEEASEDASRDDGEEQETDEQEDVAPRRGRRDERIARLLSEREEDRRRLADLEAKSRQPAHTGPREETDEEFNARVVLLDPETRVEARLQRSEQRNARQMQALRFQQAEQLDKATYEAKKPYDPRYSRYESDVEKLVTEQRGQGNFISREVALKYILGERMLKRGDKEVVKARDKGKRNIERQRTNPPNNRGDAGRGRERDTGRNARDKRLEDMEI